MADKKQSPKKHSGEAQIKAASPFKSIFPFLAIVVCAVVAHLIFYQFFGACKNFQEGEKAQAEYVEWVESGGTGEAPPKCTDNEPANTWGLIYKGGFVIPIGMTLLFVLLVFTIERGITIFSATGRGNTDVFVKKVRRMLGQGDIDAAALACDKQKGSVGNVIKAGLRKYKEMTTTADMEKEQKKVAIQTEIEEATMLELPMLERNLPIIATTASLGTLVGLIGTVLGMIRAFSALGEGGAPNAAELSVGISEALINTALGITTSALSILVYNFFTTKIDGMTYAMDEAGYSIVQTFDVRN